MVKRTVNKDGSTEALEHVSDLGAPCHFLHKVSGDSNCDHGDIIGDGGDGPHREMQRYLATILQQVILSEIIHNSRNSNVE